MSTKPHITTLNDERAAQGLECDGEEIVTATESELSPATKDLLVGNSSTIGRDSRPTATYEEWREATVFLLSPRDIE